MPRADRILLLGLTVLLACKGEPAAETTPRTEETPSDSSARAEATPKAPEADPPKTPEPPAPTPQQPEAEPDEWLLWFSRDGQFVTRWLDLAKAEAPLVAERKALLLSDGQLLWRVYRDDAEVDLTDCACLDAEEDGDPELCKPYAKLTTLGLKATELLSGQVSTLQGATNEPMFGNDIYLDLGVVGGNGHWLMFTKGESGYFCGAHGLVEGQHTIYDLKRGEAVREPFGEEGHDLPEALVEGAAREIHEQLEECEGDEAPSVKEIIDEEMGLTDIHVSLVGGEPRVDWHFEADTYYACSPDYAAHGSGHTGLVEAGAPLGLAGPLPDGLQAELRRIGTASAVGWSRLELSPQSRPKVLEAFRGAAEDPWPPSSSSDRPLPTTDPAKEKAAKGELREGQKLTRAGEYAAAIARYDAAIAAMPSMGRAWSERGYARLLSGDLKGAEADLEHALPLATDDRFRASVHYNLGLVAERGGDPKAALEAYVVSLKLRDNETVRKAVARVKAAEAGG